MACPDLYRRDWCLPLNETTDEPFSQNVLLPWMRHMGIIPTSDDVYIRNRKCILQILQQIVNEWIMGIAIRNDMKELNAEIVPYGSYALEVCSRNSDMDILVVAPELASLELRQLVDTHPASKNVRGVEGAKVPLLKFNMHGVEVDLAFARLSRNSIPTAEVVGQNRQIFADATRLLKCWASSHDQLLFGSVPPCSLLLPIQKPGTDSFCSSNVTGWTLHKIRTQLIEGFNMTQQVYKSSGFSSIKHFGQMAWICQVTYSCPSPFLERDGIACDPDLTEYMDLSSAKSTGFKAENRVFLWGLVADSGEKYSLTDAEKNWRTNLSNGDGYNGEVKLAVIPRDVYQIYKMRR
ncbi:hypothetical protein OROMI_018839 [Orobanche minor]